MSQRKRKPIQTISIILSIFLFVATMLGQLVQSLPDPEPTVANTLQTQVNRDNISHALVLDQPSILSTTDGQTVSLTYQGTVGEIITLQVSSDEGNPANMRLYIDGDATSASVFRDIQISDTNYEVCGFQLDSDNVHQFVFEAVDTEYRVSLESGDTCETG